MEQKIAAKACEAGYRWGIDFTFEKGILDPFFWQALGKSCGWKQTHTMFNCANDNCEYRNDADLESSLDGYCTRCGVKRTPFEKDYKHWLIKAKSFHEINLTEGWEAAIKYLEGITL